MKKILQTPSKKVDLNYDFSPIFLNQKPYIAYIGDNYQKMDIQIDSAQKQGNKEYFIKGKTKVKNNECDFEGILKINDIYQWDELELGEDGMYKDTIKNQGSLKGNYTFNENPKRKGCGVFKGEFVSVWYQDYDNNIVYFDLGVSDSSSNNLFLGTWEEYETENKKVAAWGQLRVPDPKEELDTGAGEFSVNCKYIKNGWKDTEFHKKECDKSNWFNLYLQ
ncbi:MAG: hypothetical protein LBR35_01885 [Rickettsiales bacterium]|jgi:hypothetical protein|nr:hypothetical protein [Rickettsiales bacterium]